MTEKAQINPEKLKVLSAVMDKIEKDFGKGAIMKMSSKKVDEVPVIPSGSITIDQALGIGGYPKGRVIEIFGPESSGKTTLAIHAIAEAQKAGGIAAFIDAEHAFDSAYARKLGVDIDELLISQPDNGEQALEIADHLIRSSAIDIVVIDSVAALTPKAEIEGEMGESKMGLQARLMSQALRKLTDERDKLAAENAQLQTQLTGLQARLIQVQADNDALTEQVNTLAQDEHEKEEDYYVRKLNILRSLIHGRRCILVIDDCVREEDWDLRQLLSVGWKVILITRSMDLADAYAQLRAGPIKDQADLHALFAAYLRERPTAQQETDIDQIITLVHGHTLALELTARQIAASHLSLEQAVERIRSRGIFALGKEKLHHVRDHHTLSESAEEIISELFDLARLDEQSMVILSVRAWFDLRQIDIHQFVQLLGLSSLDRINALESQGWLSCDADALMIHPLIAQIVKKQPISAAMRDAALSVMRTLHGQMRKEVDAVRREGLPAGRGESALLTLSEAFLRGCAQEKTLWDSDMCRHLRLVCAAHIPREREEDILRYALPLVDAHEGLSAEELLQLCSMCAEIDEERREFEQAAQVIRKLRQPLLAQRDHHLYAQYCFIISGYLDQLLDGHYLPRDEQDRKLLKRMNEADDQAIRHMRKSRRKESRTLLCAYLQARAAVLIRSEPHRKLRIRKLLKEMSAILDEGDQEPWLHAACALTLAWYHTYVDEDLERTLSCLKKAWQAEQKVCSNDLDLIDDVLRPSANILLEWDEIDACVQLLQDGIQRCERHPGVVPYLRKKLELYGYLLDVCQLSEDQCGAARISAIIQRERQKLEKEKTAG